MKQINLEVKRREKVGSGTSGRIRKQGLIPAVVYGVSGSRPLTVEVSQFRQLMRTLHGSSALIEIQDDAGEKVLTVLQDVQRDSLTDQFMHVDFKEVERGQLMTVSVSVHIVGESIGVKSEGGVLDVRRHELNIRCLPRNLPELIEVDVSELHAGDLLHISDLKVGEGINFVDDPAIVVVGCSHAGSDSSDEAGEAEEAAEEPAAAAPAAAE